MDFLWKSDAVHRISIENLFFQYLFIFYRKNSKKFKKIQKKSKFGKKYVKVDFQPKSDAVHRISVENPFFQFLFIFLWEK